MYPEPYISRKRNNEQDLSVDGWLEKIRSLIFGRKYHRFTMVLSKIISLEVQLPSFKKYIQNLCD